RRAQGPAPAAGSAPGSLALGGEGVAVGGIAGVVAGPEPALALLGRAVRPGLGPDVDPGLLLEPVVADSFGRGQALLDVAVLQGHVAALLAAALGHRVGPDPGVAVGLELQANRPLVGLRLRAGRLLAGADLGAGAVQVLDVVADLVGHDVGLREVAGGVEAAGQLVEEAEVEVHLAVGRAVEGPGRGAGRAATGADLAVEAVHGGVGVVLAFRREDVGPLALDVLGEERDELVFLGLGTRGLCPVFQQAAEPAAVPPV